MIINLADEREVAKAIRSVILKYCRKYKSKNPIMCTASFLEEVERDTKRNKIIKKKFIYDSLEIAETCAREIVKVSGEKQQRAYPCPRSKHGHYHLTRKPL